ncbi:hypothetical protein QJS04_geneDACA023406 [Acorus gramineus]|uniref:Secreted protein n=1 Tax=Acorus gramineus TaxID=55184 RepID=A0AAV9A0S6_ACOGR|nr:hypothetical protein QJS04_geneDACA023406 [Acorus gramineus]
MQVHPNVFRVLAVALYLNETWGYGLGICEVMYFYRFARCPGSSQRYCFVMRGDKYLMQGIPDHDRGWKDEVAVIGGP